MKALTIVGIVLMALGVVALVYQGFSYTTKEKVLELGPLKAEVEHQTTVPVPPILGVLAVAGGVVLVIVGARRS